MSEVKRGDRLAMRRLYDEYSGYAMSVGLRYVPDKDDVLDILQDSFIKVFQRIGDFEYRGEVRSSRGYITANEALGLLRQRNRVTFTDKLPEASTDDEPDMTMVSDDVLNGMIGASARRLSRGAQPLCVRRNEPQGDCRRTRHKSEHVGVAVLPRQKNARKDD